MKKILAGLTVIISVSINAQQVGSTDFVPVNSKKTFSETDAPTVLIDEAHHNFHTMNGRYQPFSKILKSDIIKISQAYYFSVK